MSQSENFRLVPFFDALNQAIKDAFPHLKTVGDHCQFTDDTPLPAVISELIDTTPIGNSGDDGTERFWSEIEISTIVVYPSTEKERENRLAVRSLALRLAHFIRYKTELPGASLPTIKDVATDYLSASGDNANGANNAAVVECQRITWSIEGFVGKNIHEEEPIGNSITVDSEPSP